MCGYAQEQSLWSLYDYCALAYERKLWGYTFVFHTLHYSSRKVYDDLHAGQFLIVARYLFVSPSGCP